MKKKLDIKIIKANTFLKKLKGIMFKRKIMDYGILFYKVNSIHTFFCFQNIDVIMMNQNMQVIHMFENLKPNKILKKEKNIYYTLELPSGFINKNNVHNKDILYLTNLQK